MEVVGRDIPAGFAGAAIKAVPIIRSALAATSLEALPGAVLLLRGGDRQAGVDLSLHVPLMAMARLTDQQIAQEVLRAMNALIAQHSGDAPAE